MMYLLSISMQRYDLFSVLLSLGVYRIQQLNKQKCERHMEGDGLQIEEIGISREPLKPRAPKEGRLNACVDEDDQ